MITPTKRTLDECRRLGLVAEVVERWVPNRGKDENGEERKGGVRKDLFSFCDIVALDPERKRVLFIQATTMSNASNRKRKLENECHHQIAQALECGVDVQLWCWRKLSKPVKRRWWQVRVEAIRGGMFTEIEPSPEVVKQRKDLFF